MTSLIEEQEQVQQIFDEMRREMDEYFSQRGLLLSNLHLFTFMMSSPLSVAIALDHQLDPKEQHVLNYYSSSIHHILNNQFSESTMNIIKSLQGPASNISDEEIGEVIKEEAVYLVENYPYWSSYFLKGIKVLLKLENFFIRHNPDIKPLQHSIIEAMYIIIKSNMGNDAVEESRLRHLLVKLGISVSDEHLSRIITSISSEE